jgi:hypothetical protein
MFKQSSTAILGAFTLALAVAWAQQTERPTGPLELAPGAPDTYTVQKGDTLWDIAIKFLKEPWRWPEIWRLNKEQIRNPHLIYPGSVLRLDRAVPSLAIEAPPGVPAVAPAVPGVPPDVRPRIREVRLAPEAIPTIPLKVIEPFLTQPLVIERDGLDGAPRIVATQEGRYNIGANSRAYVAGFGDGKEPLWQVYRRGIALVDPDTDETLGFEAIYLGSARLTRLGDPATVQILSSTQEITTGDRLVVAPQPQIFSYAPRAPEKPIRGRIISIYGGVTDARTDYVRYGGAGYGGYAESQQRYGGETGNLAVVSINRGARHGLEPGHVLAISRGTTIYNDRSVGPYYMGEPRQKPFPLPEERYGLMMVFRVFEHLSYALTLGVERQVAPGDFVSTP